MTLDQAKDRWKEEAKGALALAELRHQRGLTPADPRWTAATGESATVLPCGCWVALSWDRKGGILLGRCPLHAMAEEVLAAAVQVLADAANSDGTLCRTTSTGALLKLRDAVKSVGVDL